MVKHPFPGPRTGSAVLGRSRRKDLETLREADAIVWRRSGARDCTEKFWQAFAVLTAVRSGADGGWGGRTD